MRASLRYERKTVLYRLSYELTHFTEAILATGKARVAPWYVYHKRHATPPVAKIARPFGWASGGPSGALRRLPDAPASRFAPRLPA